MYTEPQLETYRPGPARPSPALRAHTHAQGSTCDDECFSFSSVRDVCTAAELHGAVHPLVVAGILKQLSDLQRTQQQSHASNFITSRMVFIHPKINFKNACVVAEMGHPYGGADREDSDRVGIGFSEHRAEPFNRHGFFEGHHLVVHRQLTPGDNFWEFRI